MKKNILTLILVIISFTPTFYTIYQRENTLEKFSEFEKTILHAQELSYGYEEPKVPSKIERVLNQYDLLSKIDDEASKQLSTMSLYETHLMSKIFEKRKADPFSYISPRTLITNLINEDEPCDFVNIKKRLECEESRNIEISKAVEKISNLYTISKYKHKALTDTIEAILLESNESIWIKLEMVNHSNEHVYSDKVRVSEMFLFLCTVGISICFALLLTGNLNRNNVEGGKSDE